MAVNALREFLTFERLSQEAAKLEHERQQREKDRILKRIMNSNCRMMGVGFRQAYQWTESEIARERALAAKQRGIMRRIVDANSRLEGMAMNALLAHLAECKQIDEANSNICNMRESMMNSLLKGREGHEKRQVKSALDILKRHNELQNTKQMIIKGLVRRTLGKNDAVLGRAWNHLCENYHIKRTYSKCSSLFRALEVSDRCIDYTYRI